MNSATIVNLSPPDVVLVLAVATNGLLAGLFFAFTCSISAALRRVDDATYVAAFRAINAAILNGWFLTVFVLARISAMGSALLHLSVDGSASEAPVIAGALLSVLVGAVTAAGNVPLNQELARARTDTETQRRNARQHFENRWNRWNLVRTVAGAGAFALLILALFV